MVKKDIKYFLIAEVLAAVVAIFSFGAFQSRYLAAVVAGSSFLVLGIYIVWKSFRWPQGWRSPFFWAGCIHLFVFATPQLANRLLREGDFSEATLLGIPVDWIHKGSETFYLALVILTIWHLFSGAGKEKKN